MSFDTVAFQADEYIAMGESLVFYNGTPQEVKILERNVVRLDWNAIVFCPLCILTLWGLCIAATLKALPKGYFP